MGKNNGRRKATTMYSKLRSLDAKLTNKLEEEKKIEKASKSK